MTESETEFWSSIEVRRGATHPTVVSITPEAQRRVSGGRCTYQAVETSGTANLFSVQIRREEPTTRELLQTRKRRIVALRSLSLLCTHQWFFYYNDIHSKLVED